MYLFPSKKLLRAEPGESPWTEDPGGLQPMGLQRVRHNWAAKHGTHSIILVQKVINALPPLKSSALEASACSWCQTIIVTKFIYLVSKIKCPNAQIHIQFTYSCISFQKKLICILEEFFYSLLISPRDWFFLPLPLSQ